MSDQPPGAKTDSAAASAADNAADSTAQWEERKQYAKDKAKETGKQIWGYFSNLTKPQAPDFVQDGSVDESTRRALEKSLTGLLDETSSSSTSAQAPAPTPTPAAAETGRAWNLGWGSSSATTASRSSVATADAQTQTVDERQERSRARLRRKIGLVRLESALERNIAREWRAVSAGRVIEKISDKYASIEVKMVWVEDAIFTLKWGKPPREHGLASNIKAVGKACAGNDSVKSLNLRFVHSLLYGHATRTPLRYPGVVPWHCFSLVTTERSFDFICPDDIAVQSFVLVISRLCPGAEGIVVSRRHFILNRAWCKVRESCIKRRITLSTAMLHAAKKAAGIPIDAGPMLDMNLFLNEKGADTDSDEDKGPKAPKVVAPPKTTFAGGKKREFPKVGEVWCFTGAVPQCGVYKDSDGKEWAYPMKCRSKSGDKQCVHITAVLNEGARFVEIRGTEKLKFVNGWVEFVDAEGNWLIEKVANAPRRGMLG